MSSIEFRNVGKRFGTEALFSQFNLQLEAGKLSVILGPSGCGKSTLLRLIAGLEYPDSGSILINGSDVTGVLPRQRRVAMVFQNYALYPHLTVRENLAFPLRVAKQPKAEIVRKTEATAALLGLTKLLDRYPKTLSGGERQRTALGRAIIRDPQLFLFDEPLSNLDFQLRNRMRGELVTLQRKLKKTVVHVTHDQTEGMTMADTLILLDQGEIRQIGDPDTVYRKPANLFVARFVGSPPMNIFPGRIREGNLYLDKTDLKLSLVNLPDGVYHVGVRPDELQVEESENALPLIVGYTEFHGSSNYLFGTIHGQQFIALAGEDIHRHREKEVHVQFDSASFHFFDAVSGKRVEPQR
ncbi:MAG: ABC transporter ATP-binding protein [candidate division Zixibacteria bacterium]|nr:ABC transporter ATP-binding protein [candidate division Zixibacteria bacterium]